MTTRARKPLLAAVLTTIAVTVLSYVMPPDYAATGVGLAFLGATYWLALRGADSETIRRFGLSLAGLLEPEPLSARRLARGAARASGFALAAAALFFPLFWLGYVLWWSPDRPFSPVLRTALLDEVLGQSLVIALPEEAFYRGYLQSALDQAWRPRWRVLGATVGPALVVSSAVFAVGHVLTEVHPSRLAVFFPSLVFGWLRARSGGIGAAVSFHAACNLFAAFLGRGYGLFS